MRYQGKIYRPWMECDSLLIQTTLGCTHNKCSFCDMYREQRFRIRPLEEILEDLETARAWYCNIEAIFLTDGNVLALKTGFLLNILEKIRGTMPECRRVSLYSSFNDIRRKPLNELKQLKQAGLTTAYVGLESGDPVILEQVNKRMSLEQAAQGMDQARQAGIEVLVSIILGLGGRERSQEHARLTAEMLNRLKPDQIAVLTLAVQPGTTMADQVKSGEFQQATPAQILKEEKTILENLSDFETIYWGDHVSNIRAKRGRLPPSRQAFISQIDHDLAHHPAAQEAVWRVEPW